MNTRAGAARGSCGVCPQILWWFVVSHQLLLTLEFLGVLSAQQWGAAQESPSELQDGERNSCRVGHVIMKSQRFKAVSPELVQDSAAAAAVNRPCCTRGWRFFLHS